MQDVCGIYLVLGDKCVALTEGKAQFGSGKLTCCEVVGFTPKMVRLKDKQGQEFVRLPYKVAKVFEQ